MKDLKEKLQLLAETPLGGADKPDTLKTLADLNRLTAEIGRRRSVNSLKYYNCGSKVHLKQLAFHKCAARNKWVFGGNRSGKTECGAAETVYRARGCHPYLENKPDTEGWVVSLSREVQRDVAQRKILHYINPEWIADVVMVSGSKQSPLRGVIDFIVLKNVFGGHSTIGFKSCDQGREKFQGTGLDYVWFDEEPPQEIYEECRMRVLDKQGVIYGTMTPLKGLTFVYHDIYLRSGVGETACISMEWADNPWLKPSEIESLSREMPKSELDTRRYGRFVADGGLVYPEFNEEVHVIEPFNIPADWQDGMSIDPGLNNPLSCHWYAVDYDGNVYVIAEHYEAGRTVEYHAGRIKEISAALNWKNEDGRYRALIDSAAGQRTLAASKSVAELFYEQGILVNTQVNKDVFSGISRVKTCLMPAEGPPRLYIFRSCANLIREFKSYWWADGDNPRKKDDHALDELRYYLMSRPEAHPAVREKSVIQKDISRRIRRGRAGRR